MAVVRDIRYYRTHKYTRKTDGAKVIAYYHHSEWEGSESNPWGLE